MAVLRRSPRFRAHQVTALVGLTLVAIALFWAPLARADFRSVQIVDNAFQPDNLVVQLGDTVVWQHNGDRPHGVRSSDGLWDSSPGCAFETPGPCMKRGDTFSVTFQRVGTFQYFCPVHGAQGGASAMAGQVTVASNSGGGTTASTTSTTRRTTTTTAQPTTTTSPTTTRPGGPTTTAPGTATSTSLPTVTAAPGSTVPVALTTGTTLVAAPTTTPLTTAPGSDRTTLVIIGLVVLAAGLAAAAWYYRPGRPPAV